MSKNKMLGVDSRSEREVFGQNFREARDADGTKPERCPSRDRRRSITYFGNRDRCLEYLDRYDGEAVPDSQPAALETVQAETCQIRVSAAAAQQETREV